MTTAVLRLGCVYGGRQGLLADWFASASQGRPIHIIGDGSNRWPLVHLDDLADLYVRALETRAAGILHGVDDSDATIGAMAIAVSESSTHVPIERTPLDEARRQLGPYADALAADQRVASDATRRSLGWTPKNEFLSSVDRQWSERRAARNAGRE